MFNIYFFMKDEDNCAGVVCANDGVCLDDIDSYRCQCTQQWQGPECKGKLYVIYSQLATLITGVCI